ncbi:MAG: FAD-dependent oxidoreductase [SAR86 cluster bacterium]|nr:FAD-dependent oxidoreductase [SAR86 cluster bacterium]
MNSDQIVIIGGGLQGLATAYTLMSRGEDVLILERDSDVATAASFANAGMLTPSQSMPWNSPSDILQILSGLGKKDSPMTLSPSALPSLIFWGMKFLYNSTPKNFDRITQNLFLLGTYSKGITKELRAKFELSYDESEIGTIKIYRSQENLDKAISLQERIFNNSNPISILDTDELIEKEPQLKDIEDQLIGGMHFPGDETGDAYKFCKQLEGLIRKNGGRILTNTKINKILVNKRKVNCIVTDRAILQTKRVVVCAGSWSRELLKNIGLNLSVRPVKGYSLTFDTAGLNNNPSHSIVDESIHTAITPFQNRIRVAGTAEFVGFDDSIHQKRVTYLNDMLKNVYPNLYSQIDIDEGKLWHGFRPMSSDGLPFIGKTKIDGLYVNCGQGHLGWTLAMGSASLLADEVQASQSEIDIKPYLATRSL